MIKVMKYSSNGSLLMLLSFRHSGEANAFYGQSFRRFPTAFCSFTILTQVGRPAQNKPGDFPLPARHLPRKNAKKRKMRQLLAAFFSERSDRSIKR